MSVSGLVTAISGAVQRDRHRYSAIPTTVRRRRDEAEPFSQSLQRSGRLVKAMIGGIILLAFLFIMTDPGCEMTGSCTEDVSHIWGQYSPWFSVPSEIDASVPEGCTVTFAQVLSRHGARFPTTKKSAEYRSTVERIKGAVTRYSAGYGFMRDYEYDLGENDLTAFGQRQMVESGAAFYRRYEDLARTSTPFIRSSGSSRVVMSADNFTRGYFGAAGRDPSEMLKSILVIPEEPDTNNTLDHGACPRFEDGPASEMKEEKMRAWLSVWAPPIARRLNKRLRGAKLTLEETVNVMDLCPFNAVAAANGTPASPFCRLFSRSEWASYDYHLSLDKWYGYGRGNPLGPSQGVGFGNELIARLTGRPVVDHTSTNTTLDSSAETFPLDRRLYADFSHDNMMISILSALGLYDETKNLSVKHRASPRRTGGFSSAWVVPFSARMYVEKMRCEGREEGEKGGEELVRVLVNDRVIPLKGCEGDELGRCGLKAFVESLAFVRSGGHWGECFS